MKLRHLLLLIALIVPILICSNALFAQPLVTGVAPNRGSTGGGTGNISDDHIMGSDMIIDSAEEPPFFISDRCEECFRFKYEGCERQTFVNFDPYSRK